MTAGDEFYTAWDGRQYPGSPPPGWFLAADNRWWPSPDLIDSEGAPSGGPDQPMGAPDGTHRSPYTPTSEPESAQPPEPESAPERPSASWAPDPGGSSLAEPQPTGPSPTSTPSSLGSAGGGSGPSAGGASPTGSGRTRRSRRGRRSGFRWWRLAILVFIVSRCDAFEGARDAVFGQGEPPVEFVEAESSVFTLTDGCSSTFRWGSITNDGDGRLRFLVTTARLDGGRDYLSDELSIGAGDTRSWVIDYNDDEDIFFCPPVTVLAAP